MNIHPLLKIRGLFLKAGVTEQLVQGGLPASWADSEGSEHIHDWEERGSQSTAPTPPPLPPWVAPTLQMWLFAVAQNCKFLVVVRDHEQGSACLHP